MLKNRGWKMPAVLCGALFALLFPWSFEVCSERDVTVLGINGEPVRNAFARRTSRHYFFEEETCQEVFTSVTGKIHFPPRRVRANVLQGLFRLPKLPFPFGICASSYGSAESVDFRAFGYQETGYSSVVAGGIPDCVRLERELTSCR